MSDSVKSLTSVLSDTYVLYTKVQNYHWNVKGSSFFVWHAFFETLYQELAKTIDVLAERIRQLGAPVPGTMATFLAHTQLKEVENQPSATMMRDVQHDYRYLCGALKKAIQTAEEHHDPVTVDLLTGYLSSCEKALWMMDSSLVS